MGRRICKEARLQVRIVLPNGGSLDEADVALIETIGACGSIVGTSRRLGLSYRKTWMMVDALNRTFDTRVVETFPGRRAAGAEVTDFGRRIAALYRSVERRSGSAAAAAIDELAAALDWTFQRHEPVGGAAVGELG